MRVDCAELKGVEVFKPGHYAGLNFDAQHLDLFVSNFGALRDNVRPRLKLGHAEKQILDQEDRGAPSGQPALGVMSDLRREGDRLIADFSDVPPELLSAIGGGAYRNVSIEFWPKFEFTNYEKNLKTGLKGPVMTAVALLGAELPAVVGLKDLPRLAATDDEPTLTCVEFTAEPRPTLRAGGAVSHPRTGEPPMADADLKDDKPAKQSAKSAAEITKLSEQLAAQDAELVKLREQAAETPALKAAQKAHEDEIKRLSEDNAREKLRNREMAADAFVAEFSNADNLRVLPAERAFVKAAYLRLTASTDEVVVLSEGKEEKLAGEAFLRTWLSHRPDRKSLLSTMSEATKPAATEDTFDAAALAIAKERQLDMSKPTWKRDASIILCTEEPYKTKYAALLPSQGQQTTH